MFLNSIPVIGHVKGVVHYVKGDREKGRRAICEATRTTVVIGGGVVGAVAGPAGAALVAAAGGALLDSVASIATKEPLGLCGNINSIVADVRNGKSPMAAALDAGVAVGADLLTGVTAGTLSSSTSKAAGSSTGKKVAKSIGKALRKTLCKQSVKKQITKRALAVGAAVAEAAVTQIQSVSPKQRRTASKPVHHSHDDLNRLSSRTIHEQQNCSVNFGNLNEDNANKSKNGSREDSSGSGFQSPRSNKSELKKRYSLKMTKSFEAFRKTISEEPLKDICIDGDHIFKELSCREQKLVSSRVHNLKRQGYDIDHVLRITTELFKNIHSPGENIDYQNFLLEMDFVATYTGEQVNRLNDLCNNDAEILREIIPDKLSTNERLRQLADVITTNLLSPRPMTLLKDVTIDYLVSTFKTIQSQITEIIIQPSFENIYSAVYHYYINRYLHEENRVMPVLEYFDIIKFLLSDVIETEDYKKLDKGEIPDLQIEIQTSSVGKTKIVLSQESGKVIITSILFSY